MSSNLHFENLKVKQRARDAMTELLGLAAANNTSLRQEAVVNGMLDSLLKEHRTNQQLAIGTLVEVLQQYGKSQTDARNEAAVKWAFAATKDVHRFPYI